MASRWQRSEGRHRGGWQRWAQRVAIGLGASLLCWGNSAQATERIVLKYADSQVTVGLGTIETFAKTGQTDGDLKEFFQKRPNIEKLVRDLLTREIRISPTFIEKNLKSRTGEFILVQLEKLISSKKGDLEPLRNALIEAYKDDNKFSMLEVVEKITKQEILVDLTSLEQVYGDVSTFVEKIQPILTVARELLQDYICDCNKATKQP